MSQADSTFSKPGRREAPDATELVEYARRELGLDGDCPWRLVGSRRKLGKVLFEVEESTASGSTRLIGKVSKSDKAQGAHDILQALWDAGMQPPSKCCVAKPVAWLPGRSLLLQGKAPGVQLLTRIKAGEVPQAEVALAADWLVCLQGMQIPDLPVGTPGDIRRISSELPQALPEWSAKLSDLFKKLEGELDWVQPLVPSHGDYHPMNLFVDGDCITAIDIETLAVREPMYDVAYFFAQTAIMGATSGGGFALTTDLRAKFLAACEFRMTRKYDSTRVGVHAAFAFLRSLHYDFCILRITPTHLAGPFIGAAERCLSASLQLPE